jgi:hypothetical protein|tara:strand:+ start:702 stop:803 length:102 start_codon:yes stop_codon:yes gene_type:complete
MFVAEDVKEGLYEASSWFRAALDSTTRSIQMTE